MTRLAQWPHLTRLSDLVHGVVRIVPVFIGRPGPVSSERGVSLPAPPVDEINQEFTSHHHTARDH